MSTSLVLLSIPGLRREDLSAMPRLAALARAGGTATLTPSFPCVTWPVQTQHAHRPAAGHTRRGGQRVLLAGGRPRRDVDGRERQDPAPQIWDVLHRHDRQLTSAVWFPMLSKGCGADYVCLPAPVHNPDGSESLWCYTKPTELYGELRDALGHFPLQHFWGPLANIQSTAWIVDSAVSRARRFRPAVLVLYLPHLDYAAQTQRARQPRRPPGRSANWTTAIGRLIDGCAAAYGGPNCSGWRPASTPSCPSTT